MTKTKRRKLIIIISVSLFVCVGIIAGVIALVKKQDVKEIGTTAFAIGHVNSSSGMYEQSTASVYTSELIACRGLTITPDFESQVKYKVYFYDMDKIFLYSTEVLSSKYVLPKDDVESFYCRIVVYPEENEYGEEPYVCFFDVPFIVNNLEITVDKEQDISKLLKLALDHRIGTWVNDYVNVHTDGDDILEIYELEYHVTEDDMSSITNFSCPNDVYDRTKFHFALNNAKNKIKENAFEQFRQYFVDNNYFMDYEIDSLLACETLEELLATYGPIKQGVIGYPVFTFEYDWIDHSSGASDPGITFDLNGKDSRTGETWSYGPITLLDGERTKIRLKTGRYVLTSDTITDVVFSAVDEYDQNDWVDENGITANWSREVHLSLEYISMGNIQTRVTLHTDNTREATVVHAFDGNDNYSVNISGHLYSSNYSLVPTLDDGDYVEFTLRFNEFSDFVRLDNYLKIFYKNDTTDFRFQVDIVNCELTPFVSNTSVNTGSSFPFKPVKDSIIASDWENVPTWKIMIAKSGSNLYFLGYDDIEGRYKIIAYREVGSSSVELTLTITAATTVPYQDYTYENLVFEHKDDMTSFIQNSY